ncbi:MAG: hypothetical protein A3F84_11115 [Candidatus Handelsmanbacteria bacterium RIFCSPLOWO2_12_FULL_64_10]|uniref:Uncharacterized protein n=1 Tax=Handelsmanbacteria sp. (strain RIFCSPLOWO2_12_FULL_64_10) TaxID=1817868 RepID=A0A1F6D4G4_HANXR|nr:MAG: hypothetical protein A3F84_11115 [Candidatus Handelsmanbacteria bacterium RIFCSPLOWO2_12_FULL_64_10]
MAYHSRPFAPLPVGSSTQTSPLDSQEVRAVGIPALPDTSLWNSAQWKPEGAEGTLPSFQRHGAIVRLSVPGRVMMTRIVDRQKLKSL